MSVLPRRWFECERSCNYIFDDFKIRLFGNDNLSCCQQKQEQDKPFRRRLLRWRFCTMIFLFCPNCKIVDPRF